VSCLLILPWPPTSTLFPYTTLFRSWLREKSNPDVVRHLEAENAYTEAVMKPLKPLQEKLYTEMLARIKQTDLSVPTRIGDYFYRSEEHTSELQSPYDLVCRLLLEKK